MANDIEQLITRFGDAFARGDIDELMTLITDDCVFESTLPPDGERYEGREAVRAVWSEIFQSNPRAQWETEEVIVAGDRAVVRWLFRFSDAPGSGHIRGVDVFRVRDWKVAEKVSYVKG